MIFGIQLRREPQRAAHDRTPPETHVGGVLKSDMMTHVDLNKLLTVRTATFVHTFPPFEDRVEFLPVFASLES